MRTLTITTLLTVLGVLACGKQPETAPQPTAINPRVGGEESDGPKAIADDVEEPKHLEHETVPATPAPALAVDPHVDQEDEDGVPVDVAEDDEVVEQRPEPAARADDLDY